MANIDKEMTFPYLSMYVTKEDAIVSKEYGNNSYQSIISGKSRMLSK